MIYEQLLALAITSDDYDQEQQTTEHRTGHEN